MEGEQGDAWILSPQRPSDALLDRLDQVLADEFEDKMLGRVGRGHLAEVKFLKRTIRWHEDEMCFSWSGGTRDVTELAVLLGLTDTRSVMMTRTPGTKATGGNARDALEQLDTFQAATFRSAVGLIGYIVRIYQAQDVPEKYLVFWRLRLGRLGVTSEHDRSI